MTETQAVLGKSQEAVRAALETIRHALPFGLRGIDSDDGSEFINDHLYRYCQAGAIQFTRGGSNKKDDNAHIEQKNWTHVRRLLGYVRYDSAEAGEAINDLYRNKLRRLFLPSVKLAAKERVGSRLRWRYEAPQTPLQRLAGSGAADPARVTELQWLREGLDPFDLSAAIEAKRQGIFALSRETRASVRAPASAQASGPASELRTVVAPRPAVARPAEGRQVRQPSSPSSRKNKKPHVVEMTRRGRRGKLQKPKRVSHPFLRAWKSGKSPSGSARCAALAT